MQHGSVDAQPICDTHILSGSPKNAVAERDVGVERRLHQVGAGSVLGVEMAAGSRSR